MQLSVSCDVILDPKRIKFLQLLSRRLAFDLAKNVFFLSRNANLQVVFDYDVMMTPQNPAMALTTRR